jgi:hypothetical protein
MSLCYSVMIVHHVILYLYLPTTNVSRKCCIRCIVLLVSYLVGSFRSSYYVEVDCMICAVYAAVSMLIYVV